MIMFLNYRYDSSATLWSSSRLVAKDSLEGTSDGLHNGNHTLDTVSREE